MMALFVINTRSKTWREVKWPTTRSYLGKAVLLEGERIRDNWDRDGILPPVRRNREILAARELGRSRTRVLRPDRRLELKQAREFRAHVKESVFACIRETGTERDCMILALLERGLTPTEAITELGLKMSAWEALRRKMERWGRKEMKNLRCEMSSRRVSVA